MKHKQKIIIAITGASGSIYAKTLIEQVVKHSNQIDINNLALVFSETGKKVFEYETKTKIESLGNFKIYENNDFFAPMASGSSSYDSMIIVPCSMGTLGRIANGTSDNLISRTADVMLKEKRKLICVPRETPYNLIHIKNIEKIILAGGIILPASPSFYSLPKTLEDLYLTI
ncbi:MAG: UbiX family flavin prenyltransferase, partial [Bacteroidales bacterium]|nr:UbiX family flavin prenyltransferase [Bacteroidales bacterium]